MFYMRDESRLLFRMCSSLLIMILLALATLREYGVKDLTVT